MSLGSSSPATKATLSCTNESEVVLRINALQMWFLSEHLESMT